MTGQMQHKREINWLTLILNLQVGLSGLAALSFLPETSHTTILYGFILTLLCILGTTAGSHRLWAHASYKASFALRVFLMFCQTQLGYISIYDWVRLHRLHHKYHNTDLDPFNAKKGFIYAHFVANNFKLSEAQQNALKEIDMSDLEQDCVVMFQKRFYWFLVPIFTLLLPLNAPVEYWNESLTISVFVIGWMRLAIGYHMTALIYSGAPIIDFTFRPNGNKQNDSDLVYLINQSYWISYHYLAAPDDFRCGEFGSYGDNCTAKFIRICEVLELASQLKTTNGAAVRKAVAVAMKTQRPIAYCLGAIKPIIVPS